MRRGTSLLAVAFAARAAVAQPCDSLAGRYGAGDGFVFFSVEVAADCRTRLSYASDSGERWDAESRGALDGSVLGLAEPPGEPPPFAVPRRFLVVPWNTVTFLVPEERLATFVNAVNAGHDPARLAWMMVKGADRRRGFQRPTGLPEVPGEAGVRLLATPLGGRVLRVERPEKRETVVVDGCEDRRTVQTEVVRVGLGTADGLGPGMTLFATNPRRPSLAALLVVTESAERESLAEVRDQGIAKVKAGDAVSTRDDRFAGRP